MRNWLLLGLLLLPIGAGAEEGYQPLREFFGVVRVGRDRPPELDAKPYQELLVIRSQTDWQQFVARVPQKALSMRQPAPPSKDPLLKGCPIQFPEQGAVVGISDDIYRRAGLVREASGFRVDLQNLPGQGVGARPYGYGLYQLWVVPQGDLPSK